jgi:serine protease Do
VGVDSLTEVAVIKIEADDLPVANLGDSDKLQVGQWVVAIGNPLELRFSLTVGIVSAIGRQMRLINSNFGIENFIQTDAVINPGNSGGALVDLNGKVIGVNTAIATRSGFYEGYGFAIPINLAKAIMEDLVTKGRVVRAYLGIGMLAMDHLKAKAYGMEKPAGVFIDNLLDDGPAGQAGIQAEDIILSIDEVQVNQANQVQSLIAQKEPGEEVVVSVYRKGDYLDIPVILAERETGSPPLYYSNEEEEPDGLGLEVRNLTRRDARDLGMSNSNGALVTKVVRFSKANYAGLYPNLVILRVNDQRIKNEDDFWNEMDKMKSGDVGRLFVRRPDAQTQHLFIEIP